MKKTDLRKIFGKFAGKEVDVIEKVQKMTIAGKEYEIGHNRLDDQNPVIEAINEAARDNGLILRVWLPDTMGTMDHKANRVNIRISKDDDGKWRIRKDFRLG